MFASLLNRGAFSLVVVSLLASTAVAEVFDKLAAVPDGWRYSRTPRGNLSIKLQVALTQCDAAGFEQAVLDMSTPDHPNYGTAQGGRSNAGEGWMNLEDQDKGKGKNAKNQGGWVRTQEEDGG